MKEGKHGSKEWAGYVDWRNRPALRGNHGGLVAASFVLVVEVMENFAFVANASNLVRYLSGFMHMPLSKSANNVTNFMGTAFFLALVGGFLSDAFFTPYVIYLVSAFTEFLGLVILTIQARSSALQPSQHTEVSGGNAAVLFAGLYLVATGAGGIKGSLPVHGAEQFDEGTPKGRKGRSTFFTYFVFCLSGGALVAVTLVAWVEDNKGWRWGFGISTATILLSVPVFLAGSRTYRNKIPTGSPLATIAKVIIGSVLNRGSEQRSPSRAMEDVGTPPAHVNQGDEKEQQQQQQEFTTIAAQTSSTSLTSAFRFLNRAAEGNPLHSSLPCTAAEVEEVKVVVGILPVFLSTIMLNCCLAQLSTFSVQQAATMDTQVGGLTVPPASLPVFPLLFIMLLAPLYDHVIIPFLRRLTRTEMGISHHQRIGMGLALSVVAMALAALVELKRKGVARDSAMVDSAEPLPITFLWIALQYLFLGSADLFTLAGMLDFFFTEVPASMRSLATSLSWVSLAMGFYLSSTLVWIVNSTTGKSGHRPWLEGSNLNHYRLERFYWLLCVLSSLNFVIYLFWTMRHRH